MAMTSLMEVSVDNEDRLLSVFGFLLMYAMGLTPLQ